MSLQFDRDFAYEQAGEDEELLAELLDLLRQSSKDDLARIKQAADSRDADAVADGAHSIKGAAASLGINGLRDVAADMEKKGRDGDLEGALSHLDVLESFVSELDSLK